LDVGRYLILEKMFPRLSHSLVFGEEAGVALGKGRLASCPVCGKPDTFEIRSTRAHGVCMSGCGRISWWRHARNKGDAAGAFQWLAGLAGLRHSPKAAVDVREMDRADRVADALEHLILRMRTSPGVDVGSSGRVQGDYHGIPDACMLPSRADVARALGERECPPDDISSLIPPGEESLPIGLVIGHRDRWGALVGLVAVDPSESGARTRYRHSPSIPRGLPFHMEGMDTDQTVVISFDLFEVFSLCGGRSDVVGLRAQGAKRQLATLYYAGKRRFIFSTRAVPPKAFSRAIRLLRKLPDAEGFMLDPRVTRPENTLENVDRVAVPLILWELDRASRGLKSGRSCDRASLVRIARRYAHERLAPLEQKALSQWACNALSLTPSELDRELRSVALRESRDNQYEIWSRCLEEASEYLLMGRLDRVASLMKDAVSTSGTYQPPNGARLDDPVLWSRLEESRDLMKTGYPELDELVRVLPSDLVLIAARPSHGKTSFGLNVLVNWLRLSRLGQKNSRLVFFSFEVNKELLAGKLLAILSGRYSFYQLLGYLRSGVRDDPVVEEARDRLLAMGRQLTIVADPCLTVEGFARHCREMSRSDEGVGLVLVDYLQIVPILQRTLSKDRQVTHVIKSLRVLAQELDVPLLCLAQVNPPAHREDNPRPLLSHLVESTAVEQECNTILMLYNDSVHQAQWHSVDRPTEGEIVPLEVILRKHKYGPINQTVVLDYKMRTGEIRSRGGFTPLIEV